MTTEKVVQINYAAKVFESYKKKAKRMEPEDLVGQRQW